MSTIQSEKHALFKSMHERPGVFVIPNPWNAGTAKDPDRFGFRSLGDNECGLSLFRWDGVTPRPR
jgi:2-methylisocitrate lyase-like PEP mutase family enzyme